MKIKLYENFIDYFKEGYQTIYRNDYLDAIHNGLLNRSYNHRDLLSITDIVTKYRFSLKFQNYQDDLIFSVNIKKLFTDDEYEKWILRVCTQLYIYDEGNTKAIIYKDSDDWYWVYLYWNYYKCDGIDSLIELLEKKFGHED